MSTIALPIPVQCYLRRFAARRRWQGTIRARGLAAAGTIAWALAWCLVDRLLGLPFAARAIVLAVNVAFVATLLARPVREWLAQGDVRDLASDIERREPAFAQRMETVASRTLGPLRWRGSEQLLAALAEDVAAETARRNPAALLPWKTTISAWAAALVLAALTMLLWPSSWLDLPVLLHRYALPAAAEVRPVTTTRLRVMPGDVNVHEGDALRIRVTARRLGDSSPVLQARDAGSGSGSGAESAGPWSDQVMSVATDGNFEARLREVSLDVEYYVTGGDATSETFTATVLHKPAIARFHVRCVYPAYTGLPPRSLDSQDGSIESPAGSEVTLGIDATEPLDVATMTIGAESLPMGVNAKSATAAAATFTVRDNRRYTIRMASKAGASGAFRGGTIRAIPDRPPVARIRDLSEDTRNVGERELLPIAFQAGDDYGLARLDAEIVITRAEGGGGSTRLTTAVPIARPARQERGVFTLDLPALRARRGDAVELRFRAEDRAGQFDLSPPLRLDVVAAAAGAAAPAPPAISPTAPPSPPLSPTQQQPQPTVPLDPPGFEDALRAYFDAVRGTPVKQK